MTLTYFSVEVATSLRRRIECGSCLVYHGFSSPRIRSMSIGKQRVVEVLWRDLFSNTSQWWDHRVEKLNPRFPDFKHKQTGEALWLADAQNPPWVVAELAAIPQGKLQANVFAWAQRLKRSVKAGQYMKTIEVFHEMQQDGICPNRWTFLPVLNACAGLGALEEGKRIHRQITQVGCESDVHVATCLVDMYAKCGSIEEAWSVFKKMQERDVVSWNAMIGGYVKSEQGLKAIELFQRMQQEGMDPDGVTFVGVLNACASLGALEEGRHVHKQVIQRDYECDVYVATCLVDMYAKCGSIENAWTVFDNMRKHDLFLWNAMIGSYVKSKQAPKAMELFQKMQQEGVKPNSVTFIGVLNACANMAALKEGRCVHENIIQSGCEADVNVANCLVDMYAKCGSIEGAWRVFNKMLERDVVSWTAMIGGYAMHGHAEKALGLFKRMGKEGIEINAVTVTCLLSACSHGGLVKEGLRHLKSMASCYNVLPTMEHYVCMVDLLGRAGWLDEAEKIAMNMPIEGDPAVWKSLLSACRIHRNTKMAERAAKKCWKLDPYNASSHVLLSNIYATGQCKIEVGKKSMESARLHLDAAD